MEQFRTEIPFGRDILNLSAFVGILLNISYLVFSITLIDIYSRPSTNVKWIFLDQSITPNAPRLSCDTLMRVSCDTLIEKYPLDVIHV